MPVIIIKNMVCPRCIAAVEQTFQELNIKVSTIKLGEVTIEKALAASEKEVLSNRLSAQGFKLLDNKQTQIINQVKAIIIQQIHHNQELLTVNFSTLLAKKLHYEYAHLSRLFSSVEGKTIEKFIMAQKIEKVKELLTYDEMNLSEIAFEMGYSSSAHLSGQFKKITGMSPTAFKNLHQHPRTSLDQL